MNKKLLLAISIGFALGVIWLVALRLFTYQSPNIHHHANFALYVNGEQDKFDNFTFYEEVQSCGSDEVNNPKTRVHLHDNIGTVVHVHDAGSTWGHLFANLGYALSDTAIQNDDGVFVAGDGGRSLTFWLNGKQVSGAANRPIASEDRLLISYGNEDQAILEQRYDAVATDADEYNTKNDPSSCAGSQPETFWQKLKIAFGLS